MPLSFAMIGALTKLTPSIMVERIPFRAASFNPSISKAAIFPRASISISLIAQSES